MHGGSALYPFNSDLSWSIPWVTDQFLCFVIVAAAMTALAISRRQYKPLAAVLGMGSLILAIPAVFIAAGVGTPSPWLFFLWAFAPAAFWLQVEFSKKPFFAAEKSAAGNLWERTFLWINERRSFTRGFFALTAAFLTYRVISVIVPLPWVALLLFTLMVPVLFVCVIRRDSVYLLTGLVAHCSLVTFFFVTYFNPKAMWGDRLLSWWFVTVLVWAAAVLIAAAIKRKRVSFLWGGLVVLGATMIGIIHCLGTYTINFQPFILWLVTVAFFWRVTEVLLRGLANDGADFQDWRDRLGLAFLSKSSTYVSIAISAAAAGLLTMISYRYLDMKFMDNVFALLSGAVTFYAASFFLLAALFRSPPLCAAYVAFLSTAHGIFQFHLGRTGMGAAEYPVLAVFLLTVSLFFGGATERLLQRRGEPLTATQRTWTGVGSWYPYVLSFLLSALFFQHHDNLSLSLESWDFLTTSFRFPPQLLLALLAILAGRSFRLPRMQLAAYGYSLLVLVNMVGWVLISPSYRVGLLSAGITAFVLIIALERIIAGQKPELLKPLGENLSKVMKDILVIGSGIFMVLIIPFSDVVRGYWTTVSLSFVALTLMGLGFWWQEPMYRRTALALFAISIFRIVFIDIANLSPFYRMMAFFTLGGCLVLVSFLYSRFRKEINRWL